MTELQKKFLKDKDGNRILPITHMEAVKDSQGNSLASVLGDFEDEVRGLVDTPHQNYVTVAATSSTTDAKDVLPASGQSADTIYRVSNWDGSANSGAGAFDATSYSEYAWDDVSDPNKYIFLCVKSQIGEVFDISVYHNNATYVNLNDALTGNTGGVPSSLQKGGMSVKFVQKSDNKYVQYRLMNQNWSTTVSDWQGITDQSVVGSCDLVESKVVAQITGQNVSFEFEEQYQVLQLKNHWPIGLKIENTGSISLYLYGTDSAGYLPSGSTKILDRVVTEVKGGAVGTATARLHGEFDNINKNFDDINNEINIINGQEFLFAFPGQYEILPLKSSWTSGSTVENTGSITVYLYGTDPDGRLAAGETKVLDRTVTEVKGGAAGTATVKLYGKIDIINEEIDDIINDIETIDGVNKSFVFEGQYEVIQLNNPWPSGTTVENTGSITVYLYGTDSAGYLPSGSIKTLDRTVTEVKGGAAGTATVKLYGEFDNIRYDFNTEIEDILSPLSAKIFMKVGCIGDSYTSGHIQLPNGPVYASNPNYAWPHYAGIITGNEWVNFGHGGSSAKTWVNTYFDSYGIADPGNKCQAYIIGLGINDSGSWNPDRVEPGTVDDIGTDNNTFTAWYYKLVQLVVGVNADAKIFLNTEPRFGYDNAYNQAVRNIVTYCHNTLGQNVYLCDLTLYNNKKYWLNPTFLADSTNGHYTAIGYQFMAQSYTKILSKVINDNQSEFKNVFLIPYDS